MSGHFCISIDTRFIEGQNVILKCTDSKQTKTLYFLVHLSEYSQEANATYSPCGIDYCSIIVQQIDKKHFEGQCNHLT